ncbi:MAG: hypothetical protein RIM23_20605 [Coleofasciculus sp. G3-WIS-01]
MSLRNRWSRDRTYSVNSWNLCCAWFSIRVTLAKRVEPHHQAEGG